MQDKITFKEFEKIDIRAGTIISATPNTKARKPAFVLEIDFGESFGRKTSSAQLTENYAPEDLVGRQIIAVMNFEAKRVAGVKSEVLVLGVVCPDNGVVLVHPGMQVANGAKLA